MTQETDIRKNLSTIGIRMAGAAEAAGRAPDSIILVAISKAHPASAAHQALITGHRVFGENRVQEAEEKWPALKDEFPNAVLHLVGALQRNKVHRAVALYDVIQTIDRPKLARALADEISKSGRRPQCFIQVNTGEEPQKGGILPETADSFIAECQDDLVFPGRVFRRQPKSVPAHGVQHIETPGALVAGDHIAQGVIAHVPHMNAPRGIGKHLKHVVFRFVCVFADGEASPVFPDRLPFRFRLLEIVPGHFCWLARLVESALVDRIYHRDPIRRLSIFFGVAVRFRITSYYDLENRR